MSTPKQTQSQMTLPRTPKRRDPAKHYLLVEKDEADVWLDMASPTNPAEDKYAIASEDRRDTGHKGLVLLSCSKEDYEADLKANDNAAKGRERVTAPDETYSRKEGLVQI